MVKIRNVVELNIDLQMIKEDERKHVHVMMYVLMGCTSHTQANYVCSIWYQANMALYNLQVSTRDQITC